MPNQETTQIIQAIISDLLDRIGISYSLEVQESIDGLWFIVRTDDSALLIGEGGKNLIALNYLARRLAEKKLGEEIQFILDINDYHKKRIEEVKDLARMHAQRVRYFKKDIEMRPMNSYERRIIHTVLQEYPDIKTESTGLGLDRRVVIKPLM
ncbi:MAG TPA: R3H domain-containing nucleic acid-binding protein [Candidatus Paceibacterota bacterium]